MSRVSDKVFPCGGSVSRVRTATAGVMVGQAFRKFCPLLAERSAAETVTIGDIMLPEKTTRKSIAGNDSSCWIGL